MSNHEEFSIMTPAAQAAHDAAVNAIQGVNTTISCGDLRRALAAFLREAIKGGFGWLELEAIAASLHSPPPPSPTLAEAREADLSTPAGRDVVRDFLASLGEGKEP